MRDWKELNGRQNEQEKMKQLTEQEAARAT
jgi:hypothetical protein